jgi:hypothetical protein
MTYSIARETCPVGCSLHILDAKTTGYTSVLPENFHALLVRMGVPEAVFTDARNTVEYAYLKGRKGFVKLAIEAGVDICPMSVAQQAVAERTEHSGREH